MYPFLFLYLLLFIIFPFFKLISNLSLLLNAKIAIDLIWFQYQVRCIFVQTVKIE